MRRKHFLAVCSRGVGMVVGATQLGQVAQDLGIPKMSLEGWFVLHCASKGLGSLEGRGRKSAITRVAQFIIA